MGLGLQNGKRNSSAVPQQLACQEYCGIIVAHEGEYRARSAKGDTLQALVLRWKRDCFL
jgi:hypothetical protein